MIKTCQFTSTPTTATMSADVLFHSDSNSQEAILSSSLFDSLATNQNHSQPQSANRIAVAIQLPIISNKHNRNGNTISKDIGSLVIWAIRGQDDDGIQPDAGSQLVSQSSNILLSLMLKDSKESARSEMKGSPRLWTEERAKSSKKKGTPKKEHWNPVFDYFLVSNLCFSFLFSLFTFLFNFNSSVFFQHCSPSTFLSISIPFSNGFSNSNLSLDSQSNHSNQSISFSKTIHF